MLFFLEKIWLHCGHYISKIASKSPNTKNAALHMQFSFINLCTYDCRCDFTLFYSQISFVYRLDGMIILMFFLNADIVAVFRVFYGAGH